MRALILLAGAVLALGGCGGKDEAANTVNLDQALSADNIASNDVTAIDAVTGADANMAADVQYLPDANDGDGNDSGGASATTERPAPRTGNSAASKPDEPAPATANTTAAATANNSL